MYRGNYNHCFVGSCYTSLEKGKLHVGECLLVRVEKNRIHTLESGLYQ